MRFVNRFRGPIGMLSAWLLVVAVGSALVWTVISRAGEELVSTSSLSFRGAGPTTAAAESVTATPDKPQQARKPTVIRPKSPSPSPAKSASPSPDNVDDSTSPTTPDPAPSTPSSGNPGDHDDDGDWDDDDRWDDDDNYTPEVIRATWQGVGGTIIGECKGWAISLIGAPADSGYQVQVWSGGPRRIRVNFEAQDGTGYRTEVFGACYRGTPKFFAKAGDSSSDDGDPDE
jgi:hypothetical protein